MITDQLLRGDIRKYATEFTAKHSAIHALWPGAAVCVDGRESGSGA